jgi:hypothetical protein
MKRKKKREKGRKNFLLRFVLPDTSLLSLRESNEFSICLPRSLSRSVEMSFSSFFFLQRNWIESV